MMYRIACVISAHVTAFLRHPFFVLLFPGACGVFVAAGWIFDQLQLYLLILTTVLSVLASWQASMMLLRQAQDAGEIDRGD